MNIKFKKLSPNAVTPTYQHDGDACFDMTAISKTYTEEYIDYGTGIAIEIPKQYVGILLSRSSISNKQLILANSIGCIDSGYIGEIHFRFKRIIHNLNTIDNNKRLEYNIGERIGQMMIFPIPQINLIEIESIDNTERGDGGFGSTGN